MGDDGTVLGQTNSTIRPTILFRLERYQQRNMYDVTRVHLMIEKKNKRIIQELS